MKKIMFHCGALGFGGAERVILNLADKFRQDGCCVKLITTSRKETEYDNNGFERFILDENCKQTGLGRNIYLIKRLISVIRTEKPDAVITFLNEPIMRILIAGLFVKFRSVISVRNDPKVSFASLPKRLISKLLMPRVDGAVFQTHDAQSFFPKSVQRRSTIILNPVRDEFYEYKYDGEKKNVVTVGRLSPQKNHKLLIDSFAAIANEFPDTDLCIYGDGDLSDKLQERINILGMRERIFLKGYTDDVPAAVSGAKLFVLSSDYEGMPNCLMEAMALGTASISTDCPCGGPRMLIEAGKSGMLVPVGDIKELSETMRQLLADENLRRKTEDGAKKRADDFRTDLIFSKWKGYIDSIIK